MSGSVTLCSECGRNTWADWPCIFCKPQPTKAVDIEDFLTALTGKDRSDTIQSGKCMTCNRDASSFRDSLSRREYTISGMCQKCQDSVFGA